ncbi:Crp/Fnr family transcriptional regulator [Bradyrhizobium sp.]|uniref:Crp/Fnr family transcriptional regulator n=1 Tax=Bradyrhizobium sp. TaxID=376 RepID=UPI003BAE4895
MVGATPDSVFSGLRTDEGDFLPECGDFVTRQAAVSTALLSVFRGRFCDTILPGRKTTTFSKNDVIYSVGDRSQTLFFLQNGFVKVGAITSSGHEVIYDVRKEGDVVGELCASELERSDRAVALERTDAISVPFQEIRDILMTRPDLITAMIDVFCRALKEAYAQINTLASDSTVQRLARILVSLANKMGQHSNSLIEIPTYLTQEEIAQMVVARRERISTALNFLRRQGMVQYTARGHLMIDPRKLESLSSD